MNLSLSINRVRSKPWLWSFLAALLVWLATLAFTRGEGAAALTSGALAFSAFFVIVGVGQMFVITTGPGNIDLSIPANIALSGAVGMKLMDGQDSLILLGVAGVLGVGVLIGCANYALIRVLRIPPIIAALMLASACRMRASRSAAERICAASRLPTSSAAVIATGAPKPAAPSRNAPKHWRVRQRLRDMAATLDRSCLQPHTTGCIVR